jgi:hypothetical protein
MKVAWLCISLNCKVRESVKKSAEKESNPGVGLAFLLAHAVRCIALRCLPPIGQKPAPEHSPLFFFSSHSIKHGTKDGKDQ